MSENIKITNISMDEEKIVRIDKEHNNIKLLSQANGADLYQLNSERYRVLNTVWSYYILHDGKLSLNITVVFNPTQLAENINLYDVNKFVKDYFKTPFKLQLQLNNTTDDIILIISEGTNISIKWNSINQSEQVLLDKVNNAKINFKNIVSPVIIHGSSQFIDRPLIMTIAQYVQVYHIIL